MDRKVPQRQPSAARSPSNTIDSLWRNAALEQVPAKTVLFREGDLPDSLFVLSEGLIQLYTSCGEAETTVLIVKPLTCLLAGPILRNEHLTVSARSLQPSHLFRLGAADVRRRVGLDSEFARFIIDDLALMHDLMMHELKSLRTTTAMQRLILWILAMHEQAGSGSAIELPFHKSLLAGRLGMAPETLSRHLAHLMKLGVLIRGRKMLVNDAAGLRQIVRDGDFDAVSLP
jgi:CRP-like cAMP-binding protein